MESVTICCLISFTKILFVVFVLTVFKVTRMIRVQIMRKQTVYASPMGGCVEGFILVFRVPQGSGARGLSCLGDQGQWADGLIDGRQRDRRETDRQTDRQTRENAPTELQISLKHSGCTL